VPCTLNRSRLAVRNADDLMLESIAWAAATVVAATVASTLTMAFVVRYLPGLMGFELRQQDSVCGVKERARPSADVPGLDSVLRDANRTRRFRRAPWTMR
jgi:hypothetical protein